MKINDSAVIATRAHTTYGWVMHRTRDGRVWLDAGPGTDCSCSDIGADCWDREQAPQIYRVAQVGANGWDEFPEEFATIADADKFIEEKFKTNHDYWVLQNGTNVDELRG